MSTRTGTNHFSTLGRAHQYYAQQGGGASQRVRSGEIVIGRPTARPNETLRIDNDGRYWIIGDSHATR